MEYFIMLYTGVLVAGGDPCEGLGFGCRVVGQVGVPGHPVFCDHHHY